MTEIAPRKPRSKDLYPPIEPRETHRLEPGSGHCLHVEECGRADGVPLVFLHGGPGSACRPDHRRYFDPAYYRILLPDQRGSGRSAPSGSLADNHTSALVADLEILRTHLGIDSWVLFGGSWGATLALAYAETHPDAVRGLVLRGTFLARQRDLDWFFGPDGLARLLPDAWRAFRDHLPAAWRSDPIGGYHALIHGSDPIAAANAARAWGEWEGRALAWDKPRAPAGGGASGEGLSKARIATHYARHGYFLEEDALLRQIHRLPAVPLTLVHGRRDMVCPLEGAWSLHAAVAESRLILVDAGHLISEPAMVDALVGETDRLRAVL